MRFLYNPQSLSLDPDFNEKLDEYSSCNLPDSLKSAISKLIQKYYFNCGVTVNLDANSISSMSDVMKSTFSRLMQHAYSIDSRIPKLVLDLLKLISHAFDDDDIAPNSVHNPSSQRGTRGQDAEGTNRLSVSKSQKFDGTHG